ncbi:hypothetical protein M407DRAFT_29339 [Tulasnella calospora MUT 4182]|uniref:F-box domain-containing protein n=1 Tax=Tulasnella calospora MUT 4182 TaxID=1051891 RepID=A0A0C3PZM3_9AGAM|nr:hypothetical protein M407DRAFT_29339 [Tulasnella calospora MUT 4182]
MPVEMEGSSWGHRSATLANSEIPGFATSSSTINAVEALVLWKKWRLQKPLVVETIPTPVTQIKEMISHKDLKGSEKLPTKRGSRRRRPGPINLLPEEIFITVIRLSIDADTPVHDLVRLTAVCRLWKRILEEAPTLWTGVTAAEGLEGVRRALRMVQDAPLHLKFDNSNFTVDLETYFQEMRSKISQWKTLLVRSSDRYQIVSPTCPASTAPPTLELLHLIYSYSPAQVGDGIELFGGQPVPVSLKDVWLDAG